MIKLMRDSWLIFASALRTTLRNPAWVLIGLFQPICYMLLFAPLLKNLVGVPGFPSGGAYNIFTPGLMLMMAIFGAGFAGFSVIGRLREGVIERWRVTPVSRLAMMIGIVAVDLLNLTVQTLLLVGLGMLLGFRPDISGMLLLGGARAAVRLDNGLMFLRHSIDTQKRKFAGCDGELLCTPTLAIVRSHATPDLRPGRFAKCCESQSICLRGHRRSGTGQRPLERYCSNTSVSSFLRSQQH